MGLGVWSFFSRWIRGVTRPECVLGGLQVFFDISVGGAAKGRVVMELYNDLVVTTRNP